MPSRPGPPGPALLLWLGVSGHAIAIAAALGASLSVILALVCADTIGVVAILSHSAGRESEWDRISRHRRRGSPVRAERSFRDAA
jgi:hypothetical protein